MTPQKTDIPDWLRRFYAPAPAVEDRADNFLLLQPKLQDWEWVIAEQTFSRQTAHMMHLAPFAAATANNSELVPICRALGLPTPAKFLYDNRGWLTFGTLFENYYGRLQSLARSFDLDYLDYAVPNRRTEVARLDDEIAALEREARDLGIL